jgi:hypothetical protein
MHWGGGSKRIRCDKKQRWLAWERDSTRRVFWGAGVEGIKMARTDFVFAQGGQGMAERYSGWHAVDDVPPDARLGGAVDTGGPIASV